MSQKTNTTNASAAQTAQQMHHDGNGLVQPVKNETRAGKARRILNQHGYHMLSVTTMRNSSKLEFYSGPKGTVIVQVWEATEGVTMYADWPLGTTWEQTEIALAK